MSVRVEVGMNNNKVQNLRNVIHDEQKFSKQQPQFILDHEFCNSISAVEDGNFQDEGNSHGSQTERQFKSNFHATHQRDQLVTPSLHADLCPQIGKQEGTVNRRDTNHIQSVDSHNGAMKRPRPRREQQSLLNLAACL